MVATARTNVAHRHSRPYFKKMGDLTDSFSESRRSSAERLGLTICAIGRWVEEILCWDAWWSQITEVSDVCASCDQPHNKRHYAGQGHHVFISQKTIIMCPFLKTFMTSPRY